MVTLRHRFAALVGVLTLVGLMTGAGAVSAQTTTTTSTTYTPGTTPVQVCTPNSADAGTVAITQTVTFNLCGPFKPGALENIAVNGQAAGTKTAAANGTVTIVITINSATAAVVNDPVNVAVECGDNTATATGPGQTVATATQFGKFNLLCGATPTASGLALTGANVLKALLAALLMVGVGGVLVLAQRRRRSSQAL